MQSNRSFRSGLCGACQDTAVFSTISLLGYDTIHHNSSIRAIRVSMHNKITMHYICWCSGNTEVGTLW